MRIPSITEHEAHMWYGINAACERSGNSWLKASKYPSFPGNPLLLIKKNDFVSGQYGSCEVMAAKSLRKAAASILRPVILPINCRAAIGLSDNQLSAIATSLKNRVSCIIGGPGTGKTRITSAIAEAHERVLGLSPTGKGADRLSESLEVTCYTIHRLCKLVETGALSLSSYDLIIIDECGMLSVDVLYMILSEISKSAYRGRLIFVGDSGQLPSVGPGKVLDDLSASLPTSQLDVVYRYNDAQIARACELAKQGLLLDGSQTDKKYSFQQGDLHDAWRQFRRLLSDFHVCDTRLITFHREDAALFNALAYQKIHIQRPIVCIANNYDYNVFNGQCGYEYGNSLIFGDKCVRKSSLQWRYAFASTCHAAQGGQWQRVIVWIPSARYVSKEWIRTALSRAMCSLSVVVRDAATTETCLKASKTASNRISLLGALIRGEL